MRVLAAFLLLALICSTQPSFAADAAPAAAPSTPGAASAPAPVSINDPATLDKRQELAKKMHELRPTQQQVYVAIDQVAETQPPEQREAFKTAMRNILNYKAIEKISIDAMADTYTVEELQAMVDYYSKPEAKTASDKETAYAQKVYPELMRMLDEAMMKVRTGSNHTDSTDDTAPAAKP